MIDVVRGLALAVLLGSVPSSALFARTPQTEAAMQVARSGEIDRAVELIEEATRATPGDADAWITQGSLLCSQAQIGSKLKAIGRAKRCRDAFARAVALDPLSLDANVGLMQFYYGAPGFAGGDKAKGDSVIEATRQRAPGLHALMLGQKASMAKDVVTAERHYQRAVALDPTDVRMHSTLIATYASQKKYPQAFAAVDAGLAKLPNDPTLRFQFARTAALSGQQLSQALAHLDALAGINPWPVTLSRAGISFRRGMILAALGRVPEARTAFLAAKKFDARVAREVDPELAKL